MCGTKLTTDKQMDMTQTVKPTELMDEPHAFMLYFPRTLHLGSLYGSYNKQPSFCQRALTGCSLKSGLRLLVWEVKHKRQYNSN